MSRFETFSFLPPLSNAQIEAQANNMLNQGLIPTIDYADNPNPTDFYWNNWPLDQLQDAQGKAKELSGSVILTQIDACARRHPYATVRLSGYNTKTQTEAVQFIVRTPQEGQ